jgi:hypothetical protein
LSYTAGTVQANPVLNSAMQVWQRGTSFTTGYGTNGAFAADRWQIFSGASTGRTFSRQATGDTTNLPFIQYCARVQKNSGETGNGTQVFGQNFESINSIPFASKTVTFSFYARKGANFSGASDVLSAYLRSGTGTDQNAISAGFTGSALVINTSATLTTTWQRFTGTGTVAATATQLETEFRYTTTGTAGAADYFEVTGVQLEIASSASAYSPNAATFQGELAACQRYYYRNISGAAYVNMGFGAAISTASSIMDMQFPVTMRTAPTSVDYSTLRLQNFAAGYAVTSLTIGANGTGLQMGEMTANVASGLTSGNVYWIGANNSATAYIGFSAEL